MRQQQRHMIYYPQVEAYNYFCRFQLKKKIEQFDMEIGEEKYHIKFKNPITDKFPLKVNKNGEKTPRKIEEVLGMMGETWDVQVYADVTIYKKDIITATLKREEIFRLPVLTGSILDNGNNNPGYFIINGAEHMPIMQERLAHNKILKTSQNKIEVSCKNPNRSNIIATRLFMDDDKKVYWLDTNIIKKEKKNMICINHILYFFGYTDKTNEYIMQSYTGKEPSINEIYDSIISFRDSSLGDAAKYDLVMQLIKNRFLIHIDDMNKKLTYLLLMIDLLFHGEVDDRDHLMFKSFSCVNTYLDELLNFYLLETFKSQISKDLLKRNIPLKKITPLLPKIMSTYQVTKMIKSSIATGNGLGGATGLTQSVSRNSWLSYFSCLFKLAVKQKEKVKITSMRLIHESQYGFICSAETPDGKSIGLIKHLAKDAKISRYTPVELGPDITPGNTLVLIGGVPLGRYDKDAVIERFLFLRDTASSVTYRVNPTYIEIINTEGRIIRPNGGDGYIDANEITTDVFIPGEQYGYSASLIPFAHHNQAARNTYSSAQMLKQGIGSIYNYLDSNKRLKPYSSFYVLSYPQRPLAATKTQSILNNHENGSLVIVCTKTHPFAQEDSVVINQGAIDRGLLRSFSYNTYSSIVNPSKLHESDWERASSTIPNGSIIYDVYHQPRRTERLIHAPVGEKVRPGDIIILPHFKLPLSSTRGIIHQAILHEIESGLIEVIITVRHEHIPQIGDKVTSQHAQKGTISLIIEEQDMPYSMVTGMRADMIVSPHAFPSRQTFGHQMVGLASKVASITGKTNIDATAFTKSNPVKLNKKLGVLYERERLIDGSTGELITEPCYFEPVYYLLLKHHAENKGCVRAEGPVDIITRQPVAGRKDNGGMKNGEMETHCLIAHGADGFIRERTITSSDNYHIEICKACGRVTNNREIACICGEYYNINIEARYSTHLLFEELKAFGIDTIYG
jgi:DNA-directed RNA polymerase beta subunit